MYIVLAISILIIGYFGFISLLKPCEESPFTVPMPILSIHPFYIVTDQGPLYIGQTYSYRNEGPWIGNLTLLFSISKKAILLIRYPVDYPSNTRRAICKGFYPSR
jgi:hypothetical protein